MRIIKVDTVYGNRLITQNPEDGLHIGDAVKFVFTDTNVEINTAVEKWGDEYSCIDCALNEENGNRSCIMSPSDDGAKLLCVQQYGDVLFRSLDKMVEDI